MAVLQLLEHSEMYGYQLVEALSRKTDGVLAMGQSTLYPLLYNLEAKRLISGTWRASEAGRKRKYYALTGKGAVYLEERRKQWRELIGAMEGLGLMDQQEG